MKIKYSLGKRVNPWFKRRDISSYKVEMMVHDGVISYIVPIVPKTILRDFIREDMI